MTAGPGLWTDPVNSLSVTRMPLMVNFEIGDLHGVRRTRRGRCSVPAVVSLVTASAEGDANTRPFQYPFEIDWTRDRAGSAQEMRV